MKVYCTLGLFFAFFWATATSEAANGVWGGSQSACWTNSANWSASPYPSGVSEKAFFTGAGNGQTSVDLSGLSYIGGILFDTSSVAAYTLGSGAPDSQTLVLADNGEIALSSTAGNSQTFNCGVQLGGDRTAQSYTFRNDNSAQTLTFADVFGCPVETSGNAGYKTMTVIGSGPVNFNSLRPVGASGLILTTYNTSTIRLAGSNTLYQINFNGGSGNVLDIGDKELYLNGGNPLNCNQDTVINGSGTLRLNTTDTALNGGYNYADLNVAVGRTLTVNPSITGLGGIEMWSGSGSFILNGTNTFLGHINIGTSGALFVSRIGSRGSLSSNLGQGSNIVFNNTGRLVYTGTGESSDRIIIMSGGDGRIEQSGPGGKLTLTASPTLTASHTLYLQGSTAGIGEFSAPLANTGANALSLYKNGSGTWILSGTNTYTGSTTVNSGKLLVNSPGGLLGAGSGVTVNYGAVLGGNSKLNGSVTLAAGGVLAPGDVNTVGTLGINSTLSMTSASLLFDLTTPDGLSSTTDKVTVASTVTVNGTNTISVYFPNGSAPAGSYTLMTFPYRTGTGTFVLSPAYPNVSLYTNATMVRLDVAPGGVKSLLWKGDTSANWDGTDPNWRTNGVALAFTPGDPVAFDDTASQFTVASSAPVAPGSVIFNNSQSNYTVSAAITGTGAVYKLGSGEVTLTGNSPFTNTITIASGLFRIGGGGVLGAGNFGTNIVNNGELVYASSVVQTNSGLISGSGNLTVCNGSTVTLSGTNSFTGLTLVTNGTLRIGSATALGPSGSGSGTIVASGGVLELAAMPAGIVYGTEALELRGKLSCRTPGTTNTYNAAISMYDGAVLDVGPGSTLFVSNNTVAATQNVGSNTVTKTGAGTLRFTSDPDHRSVFVIAEGTVELAHSGSTDAPWLINPGTTLRQITAGDIGGYFVQANGLLDLQSNGSIGGLSGIGLVTNSGASAITLTVGNNNQSGIFAGTICNGAGSATVAFSKTGTGVQTLSGTNTYSAGTTLSGGLLNINSAYAIGTGAFTIGGAYSFDNASGADITLASNNAQAWNGDFTFIGSKSLNLGSGAVTLNASRTVTVLTNTLSVGGAISGSSFGLTKNGAGALVLSGANTYSGATTVNGGALIVNSPGSLASGSAVTVNAGAIFGGSGVIGGAVTAATNSVLAPGGLNAVGTLTLTTASATALSLSGATMLFDFSNVAGVGTNDQIALTGAGSKVVLTGLNRIVLNIPTNGVPAGTYTLIYSQAGATTNGSATIALLTPYPNATLSAVGNSVVLNVTGDGISGAVWTGAASGAWDGSDLNWLTNGVAATYPAGAAVTFDDTASGNFAVSSSGTVSPAALLFNNSVNDYSVSALLDGTGPLTKQGAANATLSGMTTYNPGAISLSSGTLTLGGTSQLNSGAYAGDIFDNGTFVYASSAAQALGGTLSGYGALVMSGTGALTLSGSNFYNGATIVNAGILRVSHAYGLGSTTGGTTVNPAGTLELAGNVYTLAETLTLNGTLSSQSGSNTFAGTLTLTAGSRIDVGTGSTLVLTNTVGSSCLLANGPFVKTGGGRLVLQKDPNGNGLMTVQAGSVDVINTMDANVVINSGAAVYAVLGAFNDNSSRIQVDAGGTYVIRGDDTIAGLAGAGLVTKDNSGTTTLTIGNNNMPETFSGVISNGVGTVALIKNGTGVQILSGKNTYTGATTVQNSGALYIVSPGSLGNTAVTVNNTGSILGGNGSIQGAVTLANYNVLCPGVSNMVGTLTLGSSLSLTASTLLYDIGASPTDDYDRVTVAGALTLSGNNVVSLSFPAGTAAAGDYTLMTFASKSGTGTFQLAGSYPNASLVLSSTNLLLRVSGSGTSSLTWNGNVSTSWDGSDANWLLGSAPATYTDGSAVTFSDAASSFNVTSLGDVTPSALVFNNAANIYTLAASIKGTAPLNKSGLASVYLTGTSSYNPSSVIIANGWIYLNQNAQLNNGVYTSNLVVNAGGLNYGSTLPQTLSGIISGSGQLVKSGSGTLTLANTNTFSGGFTINGGTLYARGCAQAMGTAGLTLSGGTLELDHDTGLSFVNNASLSASTTVKSGRLTPGSGVTNALGTLSIGNVTLYVAPGLNLISGTPYGVTFGNTTLSANTPVFDVANNGTGIGYLTLGALSGNYNLTKQNAGTLFLGTASVRSGGTNTLTAGTLKLGTPTALGTNGVSLAITLNGGVLDLATDVTVTNYPTSIGGATTILSDKATPNSDGITHVLGPLTINNSLSVAAGANVRPGSAFGLTFGTNTLTGNATFDVAVGGTLTLGTVIGNYGLTKANYGTLVLTSPNAYTGVTAITRGFVIVAGASGSITNTSAVTLSGDSTLELRNSTASNVTDRIRNGIPVTLAGGTFSFAHTGGNTNYSESLGALSITAGSNQFVTSQANVGYTSVVTLASIARSGVSFINFVGVGLGESDRNRIFIPGQPEGNLGPWATVNGTNFAFYSATLGVCSTTNTYDLAARGPASVVPNDSNVVARITSPGVSGPITLAGDLTNRIFAVRQNTGTDAVIATLSGTTNKVLLAHGLFITDGKGSLTVGEKLGDGFLAPLNATEGLLLDVDGSSGVLTLNAPIADIGGSVVIKKYGSGKVVLANANTYSGATTVYEGTLSVQNGNGLGSTAAGTTVNTNAVLDLAGSITTAGEALTLYGTLSSQSGVNTYAGTITPVFGSVIDVGASSILIASAAPSTTGAGGFTKTGAGILRLTGDPNQTGYYTISAGTIELAHSGSTDATLTIAPGATLRELTANDLGDAYSITNNGTFDMRTSDTIGMLVGNGLVTVGTGVSATLAIGNEGSKIATFSGVIENGFGIMNIQKSGSGTQILTGTNTYTGTTIVNERGGRLLVNAPGVLLGTASVAVNSGGTLGGNGSVMSPVTVAAGGCLLPADEGVIGTLTLGGSLTLNGATLYYDIPATLSASDVINVAGVLTVNGVNTIALSFPGGVAPAGDYTLMNFASKAGTGSFVLLGLSSTPNATLELTATSLILHVSSGTGFGLTWNGNLSSVWDGGVLNWKSNGSAAGYADGSIVSFDDTAAGNFTVTSVGYGVTPSAIYINNNTNSYTINAALLGTAPIVKTGWGSAFLNNALNYNPASITVNPVGTLYIGNAGNAQLNNGVYNNPIFVNGGAFRFESGAYLTLNSLITGGGSLVKYGTGTITLNAANTYRGGTTHGAGQMNINNGGTDGTSSSIGIGRIYIGTGAVFDNLSGSDLTLSTSNPQDWNGDFIYAGSSNSLNFGTGAVNLNGNRTITVWNNTFTIGGNISQSANYSLTKAGPGALILSGANYYVNGTTLSGGTLYAQKSGSVLGSGSLTLNTAGTTLECDNDTALAFNNNAVVSASMTVRSGRLTVGPGATHTLGALSINASTLSMAPGTNVLANTPYGLTFGTNTLTAGPAVFNIANNGNAAGTLTLGAVNGSYALVKKGGGVLKLASVNLFSGPTTNNDGRVLALTGGASSNSAVTVQAADLAGAAPSLSVFCSAANTQWTCSSLTFGVAAAPATNLPSMEFSFAVVPSTTVAPLRVLNSVAFATNPVVNVYLSNMAVPVTNYPLMVVGGIAPTNTIPPLNMVGGYTNSTLYWTNNTLTLKLSGTGLPLKWAPGVTSSGTWDVNNAANLAWTNGVAKTYYQEPLGSGMLGDSVLFDDTAITADSTVTLAGAPSPTSLTVSNTLYAYTFSGSGSISGTGGFSKFGTNLLTLATVNSYTGATTFASGIVNIPAGAAINAANIANAGLLNVGTLSGNTVLNISGGTVNATKTSQPALQFGTTSGAIGVINLSAGALNSSSEIWIGAGGNAQNGFGALNVTGGSVTSASFIAVGRATAATGYNRGELLVSGGTVTVNGNNLEVGSYQNAAAYTAVATLTGGITTLGTGAGDVIVGNYQNGVLNVSGSAALNVLNSGKALRFSVASGVTGIANLNGGLVTVPTVIQATSGAYGYLNFNGGTLRASKNNTAFMSGLTAARIYAGGATIDDGGYSITIGQSLLSPCTGNGVSLAGMTFSGKGFVAPPIVDISGYGNGASAVATIDGSGNLTGVTLTSPGANYYMGTPTLTFTGGGGTVTQTGSASTAPNTSGGLTKVGAGTVMLTGTNTYSGATIVSNGRLALTTGASCSNSVVTMQSNGSGANAIFSVRYIGGDSQAAVAGLVSAAGVNGGSSPDLEFGFSAVPSSTVSPLAVTGDVSFAVTPDVKVILTGLAVPTGSYPLMTVSGAAPSVVPALTVAGGYSGSTLSWNGNTLMLNVTGSAATIRWGTGAAGYGTWNANDSTNLVWKDASAASTYYQETVGGVGDQVVFDDTYVALNNVITLNSTVTPSGMTANNSTFAYTVSGSGSIAGTNALVKSGAANFRLATANSFSGGTLINAGGVLQVSNSGGLGTGGVTNNGTLNLDAGAGGAGDINYAGLNNSLSGAGTNNLSLGTGTAQMQLLGNYSGFVGVWNIGVGAYAGASRAVMTGLDNAAATINVLTNGTLWVSAAGTHYATAKLLGGDTGESYGQLRVDYGTWAGPVLLMGPITGSGDAFFGAQNANGEIAGTISEVNGPYVVTKVGAFTTTFSGANTYLGPTWVMGGGLRASTLGSVNGGPSPLGAPTTPAQGTIKLGYGGTTCTLVYSGNGETSDRIIDLAGTTGGATIDQSGTNLLKLTGGLTYSGIGAKTLTFQGSTIGTGEFAGAIGNTPYGNAVSVVKTGTGTWKLSSANTYSGGTQILGGGTLIAANPNAMGTNTVLFPNQVATLDFANDGVGEYTNEYFAQQGAVVTFKSNRGAPGDGINHSLGVMHLSGVTVFVTNGDNVVSGQATITTDFIDLYGGGAYTTILAPTTADLISKGGASIWASGFPKTLQLDGTSLGSAILGPITNGTGSVVTLAKANTSTWTLYGSNTYSGATTISGGSIVLAGTNGALVGTSGVTISGAAALELRNSAQSNSTDRLRDTLGITLAGGTLRFAHSGGAADYSERMGALSVTASTNTFATALADSGHTSVVTIASLAYAGGATLDFAGDGLGASDRNRIFITGQANGPIGAWATVNGTNLAAYSSTLGVYAFGASGSDVVTNLAARGNVPNSVVPDNASALAQITDPGDSGPITLEGAWTNRTFMVQQSQSVDATIDTVSYTTNKTLLASELAIAAGQGSLTLGVAPGNGYVAPLTSGGSLRLENDNASAVLTVNAAVANNTTASTVDKYGAGSVVLAGSNTFSGAVTVNAGTLEFGGPFAQRLSNVIGGAGALAKSGTNLLHILGLNTYAGPTYIKQGVVRANENTTFGPTTTTNNPVIITDGGTLNIGCTPDVGGTRSYGALNFGNKQFIISGAGYQGQGAIVNVSTAMQYSALSRIALAADATIGCMQRIDMNNSSTTPALDLNDHTLSKTGSYELAIHNVPINPGAGNIVVNQGILRFETGTSVNGTTNNTVTVNRGGTLDLWQHANTSPSLWTIIMGEGAFFTGSGGQNVTNQNIWNGPVTLNGRAFVSSGYTPSHLTVNGDISGTGSLVKMSGSSTLWLYSTNNTYSGGTIVSNGTLFARYPGSLPGYDVGQVAVAPAATLAVQSGDGTTGWSAQQIQSLHDASTFVNNTAVLSINTTLGDVNYLGNLTKTLALTKAGNNVLTLNGTNTFTGAVAVNGGTLTFASSSTNFTGPITVSGGSTNTALVIDGVTTFVSANITNALTVAAASGDRSVATLSTNATFGKLIIGSGSGASGAFIQNNGNLAVSPTLGSTDLTDVGNGGYGYYRMNKGSLTTGQLGFTGSGGGTGVFDLYDGTVNVPTSNGWLIFNWGTGISILNMFGGSVTAPPGANDTTLSYSGNSANLGIINMLGASAYLDTTPTGRMLNMAKAAGSSLAAVNLNSGTIRANKVYAGTTGTPTVFGFNGGTLWAASSSTTFMQGLTAGIVYPGGAVIDSSNAAITVGQSLLAPAGYGVTYIPVLSGGTNYIGAPAVKISGGSGFGATAIATVDLTDGSPTKGQVTGITITSPGSGYVWYDAPVATLLGGGATTPATLGTCSLSPNSAAGGLTKNGSGTLTLAGTNTYGGTTLINSGTLRLGVANALPTNADVVVAGGSYDLGGFYGTITNDSVTVFSGSVSNGTLNTSLVKLGDGSATLAAGQEIAKPIVVSGGTLTLNPITGTQIAGLYEGTLSGAFNTSEAFSACSNVTIRTGTQMANTSSLPPWGLNMTIVYTGYIWNRTGTNATWTFAESVDDSTLLKIDGTTLINDGNYYVPAIGTITLAPGPHAFEARFGNGIGGAGLVYNTTGSGAGMWWTNRFGFGIDFQGHTATNAPGFVTNFVACTDSGNGSLLTVLPYYTGSSVLNSNSTVFVDSGATLDLGGSTQTLAQVSGSGTVSNGTLAVAGTIAPGGTNVIGTLTLASTALAGSSTLLVDVDMSGNCDCLAVKGDIDLSKLTLQIANPSQLKKSKAYTLVTCTGTRIGSMTRDVSLDSHWHLAYRSNGSVQLIYIDGTLIRLR